MEGTYTSVLPGSWELLFASGTSDPTALCHRANVQGGGRQLAPTGIVCWLLTCPWLFCEASSCVPIFLEVELLSHTGGGRRNSGLACLVPKLIFFLPPCTALATFRLKFPCPLPLPQCGCRVWGGTVRACHVSCYQARRVMRSESPSGCLEAPEVLS